MKKIKVHVTREVKVDDDRYVEFISKYDWYINKRGYVVRYERTDGKQKTIYMHHDVLPRKPDYEIDHINGDKLDNRLDNLRYCTRSQNMSNIPKRIKNMYQEKE